MRVITIDNGNTNQSVAIFENQTLKKIIALSEYQKEQDDFILISSVGKNIDLKASFDLHSKRSSTHFFDMPIHYASTLGDDRMITGYGVYKKLARKQKILLIDAGTFITCDVISQDGFLGGHIFPGLERFLTSYTQSAKLPSFNPNDIQRSDNKNPPQSTKDAILGASEIYIRAVIQELIGATSPDAIIFTGGSAKKVSELINLKLPFELDPHLLHSSLFLIHQLHLNQA